MAGIDRKSTNKEMEGGGKIVNNTSLGVLLRGFIHIRNERDERYCVVAKNKLLENVTDSQVEVAQMNSEDYSENYFYDQRDLWEFNKQLDNTRNVIGGKVGLGVSGFGKLEIGVKRATEKNHKNSQELTKNAYHFSCIKSHIKYKLALQLKGNLQFSKPALTSLEQIAKKTTRKDDYDKCKNFFKTYGSHVDLGECHLGGVMEIVAECNDEDEQLKITNEDKTMTEYLIGAGAKGGYSFANGKVALTASTLKEKQKEFKTESKRNLGSYKMRAAIYGGEVNSTFQAWDMSLGLDQTSLHIIDRGCLRYIDPDDSTIELHEDSMLDHRSVWKLLREQRNGIALLKPFTVDKAAHNTEVFYNTFLYRERIIEITNGIQKGSTAIRYYNALLDIFRVNEWRTKEVKNLNEWGEFMEDDNTILNFVKKLDSSSELGQDIYMQIKEIFQTLMEQVEVEHRKFPGVKNVQESIDSMDKTFPVGILKSRDEIETTMADTIDTKDGVKYSEALKTILQNVQKLKHDTGNDNYWINMLQKESVSKFLLKPNKYMIMTVHTFKDICGTIKELTQKPAFLKRLSKQKEITDLVFSRNRSLNQKIEFRYHVRKWVDLEKNQRTAKGYKKALESIRDGLNEMLHTPTERSEALAEMLKKDDRVIEFLKGAGTLKTDRKTFSHICDLAYELLAHVEVINCRKKRNFEEEIKGIKQQLNKDDEAPCTIL